MTLRNSFSLQRQPEPIKLRNSTNFLKSQLIRTSLSKNSTLNNLLNPSPPKHKKHQRHMSLHKEKEEPPRQLTDRLISYNNIKQTLKDLEEKIGNAKKVLRNMKRTVKMRGKQSNLIEEDYSISQIQATIMKKTEDLGFDLTQNSTKLLSFSKNEYKNQFTPMSTPKPIRINNFSRFSKKLKNYYVNQIDRLYNGKENQRLQEHLFFSLKIFHSLFYLRGYDFPTIEEHKVYLSHDLKHKNRKTLLLDIDETILHCEQTPNPQHIYDFILNIQVSENQIATAYISLRPYALTFLRNMAKIFQIIAFTASHQSYADVVLNEIDPQNQIFSHRLYRSSCQEVAENLFTKDLRIVNRRLENMVIIDNSPYSYIFQLENAIPILPYHYGQDRQLPELEKYLEKICECVDVRQMNKETFRLHKYIEHDDVGTLINMYINE